MVVAGLGLSGCSAGGSHAPERGTPTSSPATADQFGTLEVDGTSVSYWCSGGGSPAVVLEAGTDSAGTQEFPVPFIAPIAEVTTVCTYNRLGTGSGSGAPPDRARSVDDLVRVLDRSSRP